MECLLKCFTFVLLCHCVFAEKLSFPRISLDKPDNVLFQEFQNNFKTKFSNAAEKNQRFQIFSKNLEKIRALNAKNTGAQFGINAFTAMSPEEFKQRLLSEDIKPKEIVRNANNDDIYNPGQWWKNEHRRVRRDVSPDSFDWRSQNVISSIKDQGSCGSCWAFADIAAVEAHYAITHNGTMVGLSEQELVDCDTASAKCNGGYAHGALYYIYYYGIHSRTNYPYIGWGGTCQANMTGEKIKIEDTIGFWPKNETAVKDFVFNKGPVVFDFIFPYSLQYYVSGIFSLTQNECMSQANGGHSVVIIGYGVENGKKYWIAKNSWGNYWGENGFFRFERDISFCDWSGRGQYFAPLFEKLVTTTTSTTTTTTTTTPAPPPTTTTQPPPFTQLNCSGAMDLVFVIDASDTMTSDRFTVIKNQLLNAIFQNNIKLENDTSRIGIVLSTGQSPGEPTIPFRYFDFKSCQGTYYQNCKQRIPTTLGLRSAVRSMPYDGGINDIALSMKATLEGNDDAGFGERLFGGSDDRPNVQNAMIVITGADTSNVTQISNQLKASGVQVFSIGFYDTSVSHLEAISGNPSAAFLTYPENVANIIEQICTGINPLDY